MPRPTILLAALLCASVPARAQPAVVPAMPAGTRVRIHFPIGRAVVLLDRDGSPARVPTTRRAMRSLPTISVSGTLRATRCDTLVVEVSRIDTVGGREPMVPRRGLLVHVVVDSATTLETRRSLGTRWIRPVLTTLAVSAAVALVVLVAAAGSLEMR